MSTRVLHLDSPKIDKATSGAYYLLFNNGGHTGNLVLDGSAYVNYINASGLAVQNSLVVTGSQTTHGNATFFNFNSLANISVTGNAYINNLTGTSRFNDVRITGESVFLSDIGLSGNFNATGTTSITGSLYVNGVQITGVTTITYNTDISLTGDAGAALTGRGDILVGTGNSGVSRFHTGGASSGQYLIYDPSQAIPFRWGTSLVKDLGTLLTGRGDMIVGTGNSGVVRFSTGGAVSGQSLLFDPSQAIPFRWGTTGIGAGSNPTQMVIYEKLIGSSGASLNTGDNFVAVAATDGLYKKLEADILGPGAEDFEIITTVNGDNVGGMAILNSLTYETQTWGKSTSSSVNVYAGQTLGLRIINNGTTGGGAYAATGQIRASVFFLQTGAQ